MIRVVRSLQKHNNFENPMISEEVQLKSVLGVRSALHMYEISDPTPWGGPHVDGDI